MKEIKIKCEGFSEVPISELIPLQGKLKSLSKQNYNRLKKQILRLGFSEPISVWRNNDSYYILNGHQRLRVLKEMVEKEGYTCPPIPINPVEAKDENEAKEKVLSLTSQFGDIENQGLYEFLQNTTIDVSSLEDNYRLPDVDFNEFLAEYYDEPMTEGKTDEDSVPEVDEKATNVKLGDIWRLGEHRLACGDSTCEDAVSRLMDGEKADMVFTDPPYGINFNYNDYQDTPDNWFQLINKVMPIAKAISPFVVMPCCRIKALEWWYINHPPSWIMCWYKGSPGHCAAVGFNDWEPHLVWGKPKNQIHDYWQSKCGFEVDGHPCPKPVEYSQWVVERAVDKNDIVVDLFGGSGSTLIACEKTNRKCFMMEIDPHYCQVIIDRWEQYTGKKAVKL